MKNINEEKPNVITLCGSTRFKREFQEAMAKLTLEGNIVLTLAFFEKSEDITLTSEQILLFEKLHYHKIDMSDEIYVINVSNYIGNSTRKEINYAIEHHKKISYMEPLK